MPLSVRGILFSLPFRHLKNATGKPILVVFFGKSFDLIINRIITPITKNAIHSGTYICIKCDKTNKTYLTVCRIKSHDKYAMTATINVATSWPTTVSNTLVIESLILLYFFILVPKSLLSTI